jgi:transforming growth factor-beta-induced protein
MIRILTSSAVTLLLASLSTYASAQTLSLGFQESASSWRTVVDGVMGGRSTGRVRTTDEGTLSFTGNLSLENNGGFSQVRTSIDGDQLAGAKGLVMECRGDGRTYSFNVRVSNARMMAGGFEKKFETVANEWVEVELPFEDFRLFSFGRRMRNAPTLQPELIESIGVTLSDKKPGDFALEIRSINRLADAGSKGATGGDAGAGNDLATVAQNAGLTTLLDLVKAAGIKLPKEPVTIFAPTNEAFAKIPEATLKKLLLPESRETLRSILAFHIVPGSQTSAEVLNRRTLPSFGGQPLDIDAAKGRIAGAGIVAVDVAFDGGIVHVIDTVLMPEQRSISKIADENDKLSTLMAAVNSADLARQLERQNGPWTVFAPINSAFAKLPKGTVESLLESSNRKTLTQILGLHVVPGRIAARDLLGKKQVTTLLGQPITLSLKKGKITIGESANLVAADIQAANGVIHLIDTVLLPTESKPQTTAVNEDKSGRSTDITAQAILIYDLAIERGVNLFNDGNPEACAAIYEVAVESMLLLSGDRFSDDVRERLAQSRQDTKEASTWRERAWALRRVLDDVYRMLRPKVQRAALQPK